MILGNQIVRLEEVDSTNNFLAEMQSKNTAFEGLVVVAKNQTNGRGQRGNTWETEEEKNLTFSFLLKPNIVVNEQFMISKVVALGLFDFLQLCRIDAQIKWPNDILVNEKKIAGVLIENTLSGNKIANAVVGIGLNVNQNTFGKHISATSLNIEMGEELVIDEVMKNLLVGIEKRYLQLKTNPSKINEDYLQHLLGLNKPKQFSVEEKNLTGVIKGVSLLGKLQVAINGELQEFGMQEIKMVL